MVSEAAKAIGMSTQTLRLGLQQKRFPFGEAIQTSANRYTYHINPELLKRYLEGTIYEKADRDNHAPTVSDELRTKGNSEFRSSVCAYRN